MVKKRRSSKSSDKNLLCDNWGVFNKKQAVTQPVWDALQRNYNIRELEHARFWDADGNRKWAVFPFNLPSHNHIYIAKYLSSTRDD